MKTPRYHAAYAVMPEGYIDLALCPDRDCAEVVLGQHKMSSRESVGITNRPATRYQLVKTLSERRPGCTIQVRTVR